MNHLGDTNKMVDTPRTDEAQFGTGRVSVSFAAQLERELNAANERIKRLEEAYAAKDNQISNLLHICRDNDIEVSSQDLINGREEA